MCSGESEILLSSEKMVVGPHQRPVWNGQRLPLIIFTENLNRFERAVFPNTTTAVMRIVRYTCAVYV